MEIPNLFIYIRLLKNAYIMPGQLAQQNYV